MQYWALELVPGRYWALGLWCHAGTDFRVGVRQVLGFWVGSRKVLGFRVGAEQVLSFRVCVR